MHRDHFHGTSRTIIRQLIVTQNTPLSEIAFESAGFEESAKLAQIIAVNTSSDKWTLESPAAESYGTPMETVFSKTHTHTISLCLLLRHRRAVHNLTQTRVGPDQKSETRNPIRAAVDDYGDRIELTHMPPTLIIPCFFPQCNRRG